MGHDGDPMHTCCLLVRLSVCVAVVLFFFFFSRGVSNIEVPEPPDELCVSDWAVVFWEGGERLIGPVSVAERERGLVRLGLLGERHQLAPAERDLGRMPQSEELARLIRADDYEYHTYLLPRVSYTLLFKVNRPPSNFDLLSHHTQLTSQFHINILHLTYLQ